MVLNCWQFKKCGREPSGAKVAELGVCPAALPGAFDGRNDGTHSGRYCWKVVGTLCGGKVQGTFATKIMSCSKCEHYHAVKREQGQAFTI